MFQNLFMPSVYVTFCFWLSKWFKTQFLSIFETASIHNLHLIYCLRGLNFFVCTCKIKAHPAPAKIWVIFTDLQTSNTHPPKPYPFHTALFPFQTRICHFVSENHKKTQATCFTASGNLFSGSFESHLELLKNTVNWIFETFSSTWRPS